MPNAEQYAFTHHTPENILIPDSDLALRCFEPGDAETLLRIATEEATAKYVPWAKFVTDMEASRGRIDKFHDQWQQGSRARFLITENGEACGYFGIWPDDEPGIYEVGYALMPQCRGKGIVAQVMNAIEEVATTRLEATGLVAHIDEANETSQRAITRQGFQSTDKFNDEGGQRYEKQLRNLQEVSQ